MGLSGSNNNVDERRSEKGCRGEDGDHGKMSTAKIFIDFALWVGKVGRKKSSTKL